MNWYKIAQVNLIFEHIHKDFHNQQNDYVLRARDAISNDIVGGMSYSEFDDEIYINGIFVVKNLRRQGIGTQMVEELKREYGVKINWGYMVNAGAALYDSMDNPTNELG